MRGKILVCLGVILMTAMMSTAHAYLIQDSDFDSGYYIRVTAYCSGNYYDSELHGTLANVEGVVSTALPDDGIVVLFRFITNTEDTGWWALFDPDSDAPGEGIGINVGIGTVAYIDCYGQAGYGHLVGSTLYYTPDTDIVYAGIPP
jgi:hypothetical protein